LSLALTAFQPEGRAAVIADRAATVAIVRALDHRVGAGGDAWKLFSINFFIAAMIPNFF
jgi:hypothetical protein